MVEVQGKKLGITDVVLRDAPQSLLATRMRLEDMLPMAAKLDKVGYWSVESWGGATFDSCIRYLGEDPWERIRKIKQAMPNTPQQMLFRGQSILGYRHYADDVVKKFVQRAGDNGVDVFRIFDALNDPRNFSTAIQAVIDNGKHAQAAMSYTTSPIHNQEYWLNLAQRLQDTGLHSLCIKDMAGLLRPYEAFDLVTALKEVIEIPIHLHCHATTGLATATLLKAIEAGIDNVDTSISSMSATYGHCATESIVVMLDKQARSTELDIKVLEPIAADFRVVRKKYSHYEGSLKGTDSRILVAQVPGGMLTNMEHQLREQNASDQLDLVLAEIPKVRKDLGYIPLVTPTSQIVGTQSVLNVLSGERYKTLTKETIAILKGEYGATPGKLSATLQQRIPKDEVIIDCRPADNLAPEMEVLSNELIAIAQDKGIQLAENSIDDVLTYALFDQVGLHFLANRNNPDAFESIIIDEPNNIKSNDSALKLSSEQKPSSKQKNTYTVTVEGKDYVVQVSEDGHISQGPITVDNLLKERSASDIKSQSIPAPLSGKIITILVTEQQQVNIGDKLMILEAMKMETEIRADKAGVVTSISVQAGDTVNVGDLLLKLSSME